MRKSWLLFMNKNDKRVYSDKNSDTLVFFMQIESAARYVRLIRKGKEGASLYKTGVKAKLPWSCLRLPD